MVLEFVLFLGKVYVNGTKGKGKKDTGGQSVVLSIGNWRAGELQEEVAQQIYPTLSLLPLFIVTGSCVPPPIGLTCEMRRSWANCAHVDCLNLGIPLTTQLRSSSARKGKHALVLACWAICGEASW